jgi:conjugal transfer pilus assembly protein TraB
MSSKTNQSIKRKQWLLMTGVVGGLFAVAIGASVLLDKNNGAVKQTAEKPLTKPLSVGISQSDRDATQITNTGEVAALRKLMEENENSNAQRQRELEEKIQALQVARTVGSSAPVEKMPSNFPSGGFTNPNGNFFQQNGTTPPPPPEARAGGSLGTSPNAGSTEGPGSLLDSVAIGASTRKETNGVDGAGDILIDSSKEFGRRQRELRNNAGPDRYNRTGDDDPLSPNRGSGRTAETYIPAGTYIRGVVLHGLDAPTGGQSQQNPHPVLIKLADDAVLPNMFRSALKNCMITANGYGDIAAERAYIRTDRLSCIDENGGAIDVALKGYVAGEDGKTGMRGRVVEKTGRILANAMLAAVGSGIGQAFKAQGTVTSVNALGGTTEVVKDGFKAGFGGGVNKGFDKLSDYYIKVAERMFPVVEVNGGRVVDIVVSRGVSIERSKTISSP